MTHGRPPRKPRWQPTPDTVALARHYAAKPSARDMATVIDTLQTSFAALRAGLFTELEYSILRGAVTTARAIERGGVVTGLADIIAAAEAALDGIWPRITWAGVYGRTSLWYYELDAVQQFITLHTYQCRQLSRAEYLRAVESARGSIGPSGLVLYATQAAHQITTTP